jgi:hypothetical protein
MEKELVQLQVANKSGHTALKYIESISRDLHPNGSERQRATVAICAGMRCERLRPASGIVRGKDPAEPSIPDAGPGWAEGRSTLP